MKKEVVLLGVKGRGMQHRASHPIVLKESGKKQTG